MSFNVDARTTAPSDSAFDPTEIIGMLRRHIRWWIVPAVAGAVIAAAYSLVAPRYWRATQAFIVRPEVASVSDERLGKFSDLSEMKTLQETILELTKSQSVVTATLRDVGPPRKYRRPERWPTALDVEEFRDDLDMRPPGGAEFGKTEVFYLSVRNTDRDRAAALVAALSRQLEQRMQQLRDERAKGMIAELERTVAMADGDLDSRIQRLASFEAEVGADLADLRNLNAQVGSPSGITQELQTIEAERRSNEATHRENSRLLKLLTTAQDDPQQLLATPSSLLKSQPAVEQLKEALVASQIRIAALLSSRSEKHPFVIAAREAEELLRAQLHDEIAVAIRGLQVDVELGAEREQALARKGAAARKRIARLAQWRAEYANLVASVENHTRLVEAARKNLADARADKAGALSASVINRIDGVEAGVRPIGAGRKAITAAGGFGGLLFGFGLVFLFGQPVPSAPANSAGPAPAATSVASAVRRDRSEHRNFETNGHRSGHSRVVVGQAATTTGSLFHGMTLEQAIRRAGHHG